MDRHERLLVPLHRDVWLLWQLTNHYGTSSCSDILSNLIRESNNEVLKFDRNVARCGMYFDTLHTLLRIFYVAKVLQKNIPTLSFEKYSFQFSRLSVGNVQNVLYDQQLDTEMLSSIQDILVLHMVFYQEIHVILQNLEEVQHSIHQHLQSEGELKAMDIKVLECYMDGLFLHKRDSSFVVEAKGEKVKESFLKNVQLWLTLKNYKDCRLLTSILPKLVQVVTPGDILERIWEIIFTLDNDPGETLSLLCLTAEIWLPMESTYDKQQIERTTQESFWLLLLKSLSSPIPQHRKQALYLIKRVVDFTDKRKDQASDSRDYKEVKPLLCSGNDAQRESFNKNLTNYFLVLEALEEKQKHLVTPVFPLLQTLLRETFDRENQGTGLHIAWIRCAFLRILQHDNNAIVKWGLLNVFALEPELFNDEFLNAVLHVLNTTFLYENDPNKEEPIVVKELTRLLNHAEEKNTDLVTRFVLKASKLTWGPVALFWVIHALSMVEKVGSTWKEAELEAVKSLAEINLTMHCRMLRIGSQIELLETVTHFATESLDLVTVTNVLSVFSTNEALIRGQLAWKRISAWLCKLVKKDEALSFLDKICGQMKNEKSQENISVKSFSLMIMLFYDGFLIFDSKLCPGLTTLRNLLHCLVGADSRPYANTELRNRSIELIHHLLDFTSSKDCILRQLISEYADTTLRMTFKNLRVTVDEASFDNINTNVSIIQKLFTDESSIVSRREILNHVERFQAESWNIIEDGAFSNNVKRFFSIKTLYACLKATDTKLRNYNSIRFLYDTYKIPMTQSSGDAEEAGKTSNENRNLRGKIASEYYKFVAKVFYEYVQDKSAEERLTDINWIDEVSHLVQVGGKDIFVPVVGILSLIFYKEAVGAADMADFKSAVRLCWKSTLESNECRLATEELIDLMFSSPFLECEETKELTIECTREMLDKGEKIPGLGIVLLKGLKQVKGKYLSNFYDAILACLVCGTVPRRDQKIELQARSYVLDCYQAVYPNYLSDMNENTSVATRAHAITLLHKMITDDPAHATNLLSFIVSKLDSSQNKRYFGDSQIHRLKTRLMQVLLVLQPALDQSDMESLNTSMCKSILSESSQPSVRMMQEWLLIRIYLESETLRGKIWDLFNQGQETRVASLCSIISVVYHVARALSADLQPDFIDLALEYIMPCCMSQQFNVRLYAQVIASKLYDLATELSYTTITEGYRKLYISLTKSLKLGNLMKNSIKLQDDFYFTVFNPIDDYSLQTLFYELPRLSNVSSDEFVLPQMFEKFGFKESNSHPLKLLNSKSDMSEAQISAHVLKSSGSAGPAADDIDISGESSFDIQKKFIPWKSMTPTEDELSQVSETLASRRKALTEGDNVILVASLVDKLPNLGGLSRTCEILGVKEFVVASIKHTEDKEFQSLSVSAEKFVNLVEVKPHQLEQYLLEKKETGYQLVGAEQTVNSTNLMDMKFDKKTVLLLGNEKAGVPANLIPLLDRCVEIPQVGVVRSLNVHVTGAICLWEYFKQHYSP